MNIISRISGYPIIKTSKFCPNPVALYGVPEYADSRMFPDVVGTKNWEEYWLEQIDYCLNGYWTGGILIPNRYYYYLNFSYMSTVKRGFHHPDPVDTDLDTFNLINYVKEAKRGIISIKARRKGLSFKANKGVIEYGTKFSLGKYTAGICAGISDYAEDFYQKLIETEQLTRPELMMNTITSAQSERIYGYSERNLQGKFVDSGTLSAIYIRTAFQTGNVFKGLMLDDCIFEESGEFKNLLQTFNATKWCFMDGEEMVGTPYIYGTGGNIKTSSKDFKELWYNSEHFGLEKLWVSGMKIFKPYYVGATNTKNEINEKVPNINAEYEKSPNISTLGMEDEKAAYEAIQLRRSYLRQTGNMKVLREEMQDFPTTVKEAFLSFSDNNYNSNILSGRILELTGKELLYHLIVLDFEKDPYGQLLKPYKVKARKAIVDPSDPKCDPDWKIIKVFRMPDKFNYGLDAMGLDGYDQDVSTSSSSLGAFLVYRRASPFYDYYGPICTYYKRPPRKEQFFEISLMTAIWYNCIGDVLCDAGSPSVIDYFVSNDYQYLLAERPRAYESPNSEQMHLYGLKTTTYNKSILEGAVQSDIEEIGNTYFDEEICVDCAAYDTNEAVNDKDLHDALKLAKARIIDSKKVFTNNQSAERKEELELAMDENGNLYYKQVVNYENEKIGDIFTTNIR